MYKLFKFLSFLMIGTVYIGLQACDSDDEPETPSYQNRIIGYWAITNIKTIEHVGGVHHTSDKAIPPHILESTPGTGNYRFEVLIFDENFVTVRGDMPNCPKASDYDIETPEGQIEYVSNYEDWCNAIGTYTDELACPVGKYRFDGNDLIIGSLNMGTIMFSSDNEFTLDYTKALNNGTDYRRSIYTYSRIYSLTL